MSVASSEIALISVGSFCQAAHQLRRLQANLSELVQTDLHISPNFFDYIAMPIGQTTRLLHDFRLPEAVHDLEVRRGAAYWPAYQMWLTHNFHVHNPETKASDLDVERTWRRDIQILDRLRTKWLELDQISDRFVFVVTNAQGNWREHFSSDEFSSGYLFDQRNVLGLCKSLRRQLGKRVIGVLVMETNETRTGEWSVPGAIRIDLGPTIYNWQGDDLAWERGLRKGLTLLLDRGENASDL